MFRHAVRPLVALAFALAPATADAALYRWVDELGVTHYTTDLDAIPSSARDDAQEIVASPTPAAATRALPVPTPPPEVAPEAAPEVAPESPPASAAATAPVEPAPPATPETPVAPATEQPAATPSVPPVFPGPATTPALPAGDPRAAEVAELEAQIAADRERLRQMISTKRWDSAELAADPSIREIAERLPRLQAELAALRAETVP